MKRVLGLGVSIGVWLAVASCTQSGGPLAPSSRSTAPVSGRRTQGASWPALQYHSCPVLTSSTAATSVTKNASGLSRPISAFASRIVRASSAACWVEMLR